ncbi:MAG: pentapeptide repeat-containing protein, partial [Cyanobium sp. Prado107]|nr:pentapeptide repeat-containing protein [Cyanobium sp. Prado107]
EDADLQAVNFARVSRNLCGIDLSKTNLTGAIFDRVDLQNARFANTLANGARFEEARLVGTDLRGAYLIHASFRGAFLSGVIVEGAQLCGADFRQAAGDDFSATAGAPGLQALFSSAYYRGARFDSDLLDAFAGPHRRRHSEGCT